MLAAPRVNDVEKPHVRKQPDGSVMSSYTIKGIDGVFCNKVGKALPARVAEISADDILLDTVYLPKSFVCDSGYELAIDDICSNHIRYFSRK